MATNAMTLPQGFVLDQQQNKSNPQLPKGFVVDRVETDDQRKARVISQNKVDLAREGTEGINPWVDELGQSVVKTGEQLLKSPVSVPSSIATDLQKGRPQDIIPNIGKVLTGQKESSYEDVAKGAGLKGLPAKVAGTMGDVLLYPGGAQATVDLAKGVGYIGRRLAKMASELPENINSLASPLRDYAGNKVNAIRQGAKSYWKSEVNAYGKGLDALSSHPQKVPLNNLMQKLTQTMVDRNLYDPVQQKWVTPLTSVDSQLVKSYSQLSRNFRENGTAKVGDIIKEYQKIRDSAPIDTSMGREARNVANEFMQGISKDINIPAFKRLNERYANFKNNFDAIDSKVDVWGNPLKTAKGENFLTKNINKTMEARNAAKSIESKTGQSLKGAKVLNILNNIPGKKLIMP